jgi:hypothetical protein
LHGVVSPDVFDVAPHIAAGVDGVRMVDNRLTETRRGWRRWKSEEISPVR